MSMSNPKTSPKKPVPPAQNPGSRAGGPGTFMGTRFQVDYAIFRALVLIGQERTSPSFRSTITMEPRIVGAASPATNWDIATSLPPIAYEAKLRPTRDDLMDWLDRTRLSGSADRRYILVVGSGGGPTLRAAKGLIRCAHESDGDAIRFCQLTGDLDDDARSIVERLGPDHFSLLRTMEVEELPPSGLEDLLDLYSRFLCPSDGKSLVSFLSRRLTEAATERKSYRIHDLIEEAGRIPLRLTSPAALDLADLPTPVGAALFLLETCDNPRGVPGAIIQATIGQPLRSTDPDIAPILSAGALLEDGDNWRLSPLSVPFSVRNGLEIAARALAEVLAFIERQPTTQAARDQVRSAVSLAHFCDKHRPDLVATVFPTLDKTIKDLGDKHLVLEVAELSVDAASRSPRTTPIAMARTKTLICGHSWVYQRIGELGKAKVFADESLRAGEDLGWNRNTAFCHKCVGRLVRLQAEETKDPTQRSALLRQSVERLNRAIDLFATLREADLNSTIEVGDCHSLLARTYLVAGDLGNVKVHLAQASKNLEDTAGKFYADFLLVRGEYAAALSEPAIAISDFTAVIDRIASTRKTESSEIRARALFVRGRALVRLTRKADAIADFRAAATMWTDLGESEWAARAEWQAYLSSNNVDAVAVKELSAEPIGVRMAALAIHAERLKESSQSNVLGRRAGTNAHYWGRVIPVARKRWTIQKENW